MAQRMDVGGVAAVGVGTPGGYARLLGRLLTDPYN